MMDALTDFGMIARKTQPLGTQTRELRQPHCGADAL
jgi:hypothetical protein